MMRTFLLLAFLVSAISWTLSLFSWAIIEIGESIKPARVITDKNISLQPPSFNKSMGQGNSVRLLKVRRTPPDSEIFHDSLVYFKEQIIGKSYISATVVSPVNKSTPTKRRPAPVVAHSAPLVKPFAHYKPPSPVVNPTTPAIKPVSLAPIAERRNDASPSTPVAPTSSVAKPIFPGASGPARIFVVRPSILKPSALVTPSSAVAKPTLPSANGPARIFVVRPSIVNRSSPVTPSSSVAKPTLPGASGPAFVVRPS